MQSPNAEAKCFAFTKRQCFSQSVSCHVVGETIDKLDCTRLYYVMNKVVVYVDMFHSSVIMTVTSKSNSGFTITEQGGGGIN